MTRSRQDDDDLEAFFAAARAETPEPAPALLAAILADADAEAAAGSRRGPLPPRARRTAARPARASTRWRAAAALAACAALGFFAGLAGSGGELAEALVWGESGSESYLDTADAVAQTFDLALAGTVGP
jgi:hypothetical protein